MKTVLILIYIISASLVAGCHSASPSATEESSLVMETQCQGPRPQMCTADYRPVCASNAEGSRETFSNGCSACSAPEVLSWTDGECIAD